MTRDEALELQGLKSCQKHDGAVIWRDKPYYLGTLNHPQHTPQMARIHDPMGNAPEGSYKGGWVLLSELEAVPF